MENNIDKNEIEVDTVQDTSNIYDKQIQSTPKPQADIGIETTHSVVSEILELNDVSDLDRNALASFLNVSRGRDQEYAIIDQMCQDSIPSAMLELCVEDATAMNEDKKIVWVTADNPNIGKTVEYILNALQVNKYIHRWVSCIVKYGDVYLRLYRKSEYGDDPLFKNDKNNRKFLNEDAKKAVKEDINVHVDKETDPLVLYADMIDNPATMYELTKYGKTAGFIQTHLPKQTTQANTKTGPLDMYSYSYKQQFRQDDIDIYEPYMFVHGSLDDNIDRVAQEVTIILNKDPNDIEQADSATYKVRSGQSVFYNLFKIWRELSLLETSLILNRLTKSGVTRVIQVETGNTAKEETSQILQSVKQLIEQKAAFNPGSSFAEYNNPGPLENNIYVPTHDGKGAITTTQIGGEYDPKQLTDLDYFKNKFYGAMGIPKQYFGDTDDGAGFNGGQSLTIISSKYAKKIIKIQAAVLDMLTTLVNVFLLDREMDAYVNKFTLHMLPPMTQEDLDRRDYSANQIGLVRDIMDLLTDLQDNSVKLSILKILLSNIINDSEVIDLIQKEIEKLEDQEESNENGSADESSIDKDENIESSDDFNFSSRDLDNALDLNEPEDEFTEIETETPEQPQESDILPTPEETGVDLVDTEEI